MATRESVQPRSIPRRSATTAACTAAVAVSQGRSGAFSTTNRVGGSELESTTIGKVRFDGQGAVYAATSRGLWKHSAASASGSWRRVLYPVPDPVVNGVARTAGTRWPSR